LYSQADIKEEESIYNKLKDTFDRYGSTLDTEEKQALFLQDLKT